MHERVLERPPAAYLVQRPGRHHPALGQHRDVVAEPLHQRHHVTGEHDRAAACHEPLQDRADRRGRHRVHRLERLVEQEQLRVVQQRSGQRDLLAHAGGVVHHHDALRRVEFEHAEQFIGALADHLTGHAAEQAQVRQDLAPSQPVRQGQAVRQHADQRLGGHRIAPHVPAEDRDRTAVRPQQAHRHRQRGGLARPVRPDQAEERASRYPQVDVIDGHILAEALEQPGELERGRIVRRDLLAVLGRRAGHGIPPRQPARTATITPCPGRPASGSLSIGYRHRARPVINRQQRDPCGE
jgi:hypothetical protein